MKYRGWGQRGPPKLLLTVFSTTSVARASLNLFDKSSLLREIAQSQQPHSKSNEKAFDIGFTYSSQYPCQACSPQHDSTSLGPRG